MHKDNLNDIVIGNNCNYKKDIFSIYGKHVAIDDGFYCTTKFVIGSYVHIGPYVTIIGGRNSSFFAAGFNNIMAGARIICASDRFDDSGLFGAMIPAEYKGNQINAPVIMEKFSNIGTNAIVMPGSWINEGVLIAAGSLFMGGVTKPWGVYKGNPAKLVKVLDSTKALDNYAKLIKDNESNSNRI